MPRGQVGDRTPHVDGAEDLRRIRGGQEGSLPSPGTPQQEDVAPVDRRRPADVFHRVQHVTARLPAAAGIATIRVRSEIRTAKIRQQQRPAVMPAQRQIGFDLIEPVVTPGMKTHDERHRRAFSLRRMKIQRRLKRTVQRGWYLKFRDVHVSLLRRSRIRPGCSGFRSGSAPLFRCSTESLSTWWRLYYTTFFQPCQAETENRAMLFRHHGLA